MKKITFLLMFVMTIMMANAQIIRYVKVVATGTGDGTSWENAAGTADVQIMLNNVSADANKGEVRFAAGTYLLSTNFVIKDGASCYGGYPAEGGDTRDLLNNLTILDGQNACSLIRTNGDADLLTTPTIWDGFILQNGKNNYGAAAAIGYHVLLRNCIIRNNREAGTGSGYGAIFDKSTATGALFHGCLVNCVIVNNTTARGAVFIADNKNASIINCVIANNLATGTPPAGQNSSAISLGNYIHYTQIYNNIIWGNTGSANCVPVCISNGTIGDLRYNIIQKNATDLISNNINSALLTLNYYEAPTFAQPTTFVGASTNTDQQNEIYNSDWRLKNGSKGVNDNGSSGQVKDRVFVTTAEVIRNYTDYISTDIMGSNRVIGTLPEIGAYEFNPIVVTTTSADAFKGSVSAGITVSKGSSATVTATSNTGYVFSKWNDGTNDVSTTASYTFIPTVDITLTANFVTDMGTGVNQLSETNLVTVQGRNVHINFAGEVQIYNSVGRLMVSKKVADSPISLNSAGIYLVKMTTLQGVIVRKILVY